MDYKTDMMMMMMIDDDDRSISNMICAFLTCIPPYAFRIFTPIPKDVINIHKNQNQMTYKV